MVTLRPRAARIIVARSTSAEEKPADRRLPRRWSGAPLGLLLPAAVVAALMLVPVLYLIIRASEAGTGVWDLLFRVRTAIILKNTAVLAGAVGVASALIGVPLAWLTARTDLPFRRFWSTVAALPLVIPSYVGALTVVAALGPKGLLQEALNGLFGVERLPEIYGLFGAWLTLTLFTYPYVFLSVRAALRGLDPSLDEAARCLGYGPWRTFFLTTLPQLRPAVLAGALLTALYTVSDFGVVTLLRYDAFTRAIYVQYRSSFDRTLAASLALLLVVFALALLAVEARFRGRAAYHRLGAGAARRARPLPLGSWRYPALAFCLVVFGLSLGMPLGVLGYWLVRSLTRGETIDGLGSAALHSVMVGGWAAAVATVAALPIAILAVRYRGRSTRWIERICYLGYGLPGIVIALSFVFIGARYLTPLYQTLPLLIVAYVVRFLPQALGATRTSLLQISPRLEEAARNLGRTSTGAVTAVTVPLARPGIAAGAALVFLTVMKELPITLLLSPTGYKTLATTVWTAAGSGSYGEAAAPALLLVAISAVPTLLLVARERVQARGDE
ncbi:MAG: iron(III) transport system permease protein [Thermomicrobiales bacterium]|nr:iron(III) transport system permease protein [Thermomicrobiales bacterium]